MGMDIEGREGIRCKEREVVESVMTIKEMLCMYLLRSDLSSSG